MTSLSNLTADARKIVREELGNDLVEDVRVSDYTDEEGESAYQVEVIVSAFDPNIITTEKRSAVRVALIRKLDSKGDQRFPFVTFVTLQDLADSSAND